MFNFTTQTVFNQVSTSGADRNLWVATGKVPAIRLGNVRFNAADIVDIQVKKPTPESLANVTFDLTKAIPEEGTANYRFAFYIGLSMASQDSFYSNDIVYKGRPFYVEFSASSTDSADTVAKRVKTIANKYQLLQSDTKILDIDVDGGDITFTAANGYQILKKANLQKYNDEAKAIDCCSSEGDYEDLMIGVPVVFELNNNGVVSALMDDDKYQKMDTDGEIVSLADNEVPIVPGAEAFGDYNWIIHNLRLPTPANTNFWAPTKDEMPVPGQVYTQIIVRMSKDREGISGEIVGAKSTSVTTHVFYVAGNYTTTGTAAKTVKDALTTLAGASKVHTDADDVLSDPFGQG